MDNLWSFLLELIDVVLNLGTRLYFFITTPLNSLADEVPGVFGALLDTVLSLFGDLTFMHLFLGALIIILLIKIVKKFTPNGGS